MSKDRVVSLDSRRCVRVILRHGAVDHVEAILPLVQPQLEIRSAAAIEVVRPPFHVENTVRRTAGHRGENAFARPIRELVVPVGENGVVMGWPRQTNVSPSVIHGG